jgi:hypothetical protein
MQRRRGHRSAAVRSPGALAAAAATGFEISRESIGRRSMPALNERGSTMVGHGWQTIEAAPRRAAAPTLLAPQPVERDASPRKRTRARVRRVVLFVPALRAVATPAGGERGATRGHTPPRWPVG